MPPGWDQEGCCVMWRQCCYCLPFAGPGRLNLFEPDHHVPKGCRRLFERTGVKQIAMAPVAL